MPGRILFTLMAAQWLLAPTMAFNARSVPSPFKTPSSTTELKSSMTHITEQEASYLMAKAKECAFSDSCSVEESQEHLYDVLNIQVACASGAVAGQDVCEDAVETAEIVSRLRQHAETGSHGLTTRQQALMAGSVLPLTFLVLTCASMLLVNADPNVTPFTFQEVVWAARDGYLDDLVAHFLHNGGLLVGVDSPDVVPFTFQEVAWAAKGGYLDDMMAHFMRNGGLAV